MAKVLVTERHLNNIAEAIRAKNGASTAYRPGDMAAAIQTIPTGGITPTGTVNITQNGTHDVTQYASANVNVQPNLQSKTATENGTVTPDQGYDGLSSVVVDVQGGGFNLIEEWNYTGTTPRIGTLRQCSDHTINGISFGTAGASFTSTNSYIRYNRLFFNGCTIEIDVGAMSLSSGTHRRFIMAGSDSGLIYRSNGKWSFYGTSGSWATDTDITDGGYFANSTVKIEIDVNGYWHIYRNGILIYEPNRVCDLNAYDMFIGAASTSIYDTVITGLRVY